LPHAGSGRGWFAWQTPVALQVSAPLQVVFGELPQRLPRPRTGTTRAQQSPLAEFPSSHCSPRQPAPVAAQAL
jgi:hypothetical protein